MKIDKFHKCKKLICLLLCFQVLCCFGVLVALKFELDFQTICLLPKVLGMLVMLIGAICTVLLILLFWHSRCPNCGKPLFTRLIEYKRMRQMEKEEKMECPHCKSKIAINETDEGQVRRAKLGWTKWMVRQVKRDSNLRNERSSHWQEIDSQLGRQAAWGATRVPKPCPTNRWAAAQASPCR